MIKLMQGTYSIRLRRPGARMLCIQALFGLLLAGLCSASLATDTVIENIRLSIDGDKNRLVLDLSNVVSYRLFSLNTPTAWCWTSTMRA